MSSFAPIATPKPTGAPILIYTFSAADDDSGEPVWYFVGVSPDRSDAFTTALNDPSASVDLTQYGKVLASGRGSYIPDDVREAVYRQYSVNA